jgi:hypothetical protein
VEKGPLEREVQEGSSENKKLAMSRSTRWKIGTVPWNDSEPSHSNVTCFAVRSSAAAAKGGDAGCTAG